MIRTRPRTLHGAILFRIALDLRRRTAFVFLEGSYSYKIDYSEDFLKTLETL